MVDKKELKKQYKETQTPMGVYQIKNLVNGRIFIGSSPNLPGKINSYSFQLKMGSHPNSKLQEDFRLHGGENFTFTVLDKLEPKEGAGHDYAKDLKVLEDMWLEKLQPYGEKGYNKKR